MDGEEKKESSGGRGLYGSWGMVCAPIALEITRKFGCVETAGRRFWELSGPMELSSPRIDVRNYSNAATRRVILIRVCCDQTRARWLEVKERNCARGGRLACGGTEHSLFVYVGSVKYRWVAYDCGLEILRR